MEIPSPYQSLITQVVTLLTILCSTQYFIYGFTLFNSKDPFYQNFVYKGNYILLYDDVGMLDEYDRIVPPRAAPLDAESIRLSRLTSPRAIKKDLDAILSAQDKEETFYTTRREVHFQTSFKIPLLNIKSTNTRFYAAYTQNSCWQAYTGGKHAFMRENNYNPEIFIEQDFTMHSGLGPQIQKIKFGLIHQSNGRGMKPGPELENSYERSWNRLYLAINFKFRPYYTMILEPWKILQTGDLLKYNQNIAQYLGWGQITFIVHSSFFNVKIEKRLKSLQVMTIIPISPSLNCIVRYFNGYGSTVGMYNRQAHSVGIGIALREGL